MSACGGGGCGCGSSTETFVVMTPEDTVHTAPPTNNKFCLYDAQGSLVCKVGGGAGGSNVASASNVPSAAPHAGRYNALDTTGSTGPVEGFASSDADAAGKKLKNIPQSIRRLFFL